MKKLTILIFIVLIMTLGFADAQAALNLSVTPLTGGNSLRFGRISSGGEVSKEVRIRISSSDGKQYQVFHRLVDSFINEKNAPLGSDVISTYTLLGSNASGTLYAQNRERMGFSDQLLYSSGSSGESDSFTVAYAIDGSRVSATGNFFGRVQYTVRPIGGSGHDNVILNVIVEVTGELKVEVEGSSTADSVRLKLKGDRNKEGFVRLSFEENLGREIKVFQEVDSFLQDELLEEIDRDAVLLIASGSTKGELWPSLPVGLMRKRSMVYSSRESEDEFYVHFALNQEVIERQKAGIYKGQLKYIVEADGTERRFNIDLEVEVEPVFAIEVDLPPGGLSFDRLLPGGQPIVREVTIEIKSNLGRPYMVMQNIASALTNEKGNVVPEDDFTIKGEVLDGASGRSVYEDFSPVVVGEDSVFFSDNKGSPSQLKILYRLRPFSGMAPGGYSTSIRYSLGEI